MYVCTICLSQNVVDKFLRIVFQGWDGMSQQQQILVVMQMMIRIQE